jgi:hypothetical protein
MMVADQIDVLCHLAITEVNKDFWAAKKAARKWEPNPCPPRPERRNRWTPTT